jgi:hypothetical protein
MSSVIEVEDDSSDQLKGRALTPCLPTAHVRLCHDYPQDACPRCCTRVLEMRCHRNSVVWSGLKSCWSVPVGGKPCSTPSDKTRMLTQKRPPAQEPEAPALEAKPAAEEAPRRGPAAGVMFDDIPPAPRDACCRAAKPAEEVLKPEYKRGDRVRVLEDKEQVKGSFQRGCDVKWQVRWREFSPQSLPYSVLPCTGIGIV